MQQKETRRGVSTRVRYWIVKGKPGARNEWDDWLRLRPQRHEWTTFRAPRDFARGDRLFFWESAPKCRVVGFGAVVNPQVQRSPRAWNDVFSVRYLTHRFTVMAGIGELRRVPELTSASFLKPAASGTIFPLTDEQARVLYAIICAANPGVQVWGQLRSAEMPLDQDVFAHEGDERYVRHLARERNAKIVALKKADFVRRHGRLHSEACQRDLPEYGKVAGECFEVHHRLPLSRSAGPVRTRLHDLAVLCPTCHRAIHRDFMSVEKLAKAIARSKQRA